MGDLALPLGGMPRELEWIAARAAAQASAENFPVALRMLPRGPRAHLRRVYAYARFVDDIGDIAQGDRLALLGLIESDVRALFPGTPGRASAPLLPIVRDLRAVIDECALPAEPFLDLIDANRADQRTTSYETFDDLLDYCRLSAAPVGRIVLGIAGAATERNIADSDAVCAALQVLEHCQDVREDAAAGRVYLPAQDLRAAGVAGAELVGESTSFRLSQVIADQVERAVALLAPGRALIRRLSGWSRLAVTGYVAGGLATADALRESDYDVLAQHVGPSSRRTARRALSLIGGR
jgi:squalene synthase HpnC